ncbi:MAG TPA: AlkA N-terminal domain-containing protein [Gemmatimonadaceae bacterium]|nr:AlkA N-terminal domain-containing protein [Gemmatimonadaceae bacterium]
MPLLDRESCTRALEARDARFDGVFFVGISSTGIYCRPICPARATLRKNRRFFSNAAAAERAGFRPCLRCRPELAPGFARVDAVPRLAHSAAARIAAGALNGRSVDVLAHDLGVSGRQLRRALQQELGVSPIELAQTHRLLLAKHLLADTRLPMTQVAFASGFQSLRRFNALFRARYRLNPEAMRRRGAAPPTSVSSEFVQLTLSYRPPIDWDALLGFLGARATPGVELVDANSYARTIRIDGHAGIVRVTRERPSGARRDTVIFPVLHLEVSATLVPVLMQVCARVRQLFDLDAEPATIEAHLASSLGPIRKIRPGLRVPGAFDGFELAVRAILGQQVSVRGATTLMSRLAATFGEAYAADMPGLARLAVTADRIADAGLARIKAIGLPATRAATIHSLARHVADGTLRIEPDADVRALTGQMTAIAGIGPWTAEYVAMRALHWPDAFPATDLVLRRNAGNITAAQLLKAADRWRPWRAYAAMQLWMTAAR